MDELTGDRLNEKPKWHNAVFLLLASGFFILCVSALIFVISTTLTRVELEPVPAHLTDVAPPPTAQVTDGQDNPLQYDCTAIVTCYHETELAPYVFLGEGITFPHERNKFRVYTPNDSGYFYIAGVRFHQGIRAYRTVVGHAGWALFRLHGEFIELTGLIGHVHGRGNGHVRFFGDGLYIGTIELQWNATEKPISIPLAGVDLLEIYFSIGSNVSYAIGNAKLIR